MENNLNTNKIKRQQKQILFLLYKFRFLTINQLQKYFNHKDPHRVKEWLKDLREDKQIYVIKNKKNPTKPFTLCLDTRAKDILAEDKYCDKSFLERLYKEKMLTENFRNHCLFIFDTYLFFLFQKQKEATIHFLTQQDLIGCEFLPEELPDVYIAVETKEGTDRYFLDLYDEYKNKAFLPRQRIKQYISYRESENWQTNTENSSFPMILFVLQEEQRKKHIYHYGKAILEKTFEDISLFLTTQDTIRVTKDRTNIWQAVE